MSQDYKKKSRFSYVFRRMTQINSLTYQISYSLDWNRQNWFPCDLNHQTQFSTLLRTVKKFRKTGVKTDKRIKFFFGIRFSIENSCCNVPRPTQMFAFLLWVKETKNCYSYMKMKKTLIHKLKQDWICQNSLEIELLCSIFLFVKKKSCFINNK